MRIGYDNIVGDAIASQMVVSKQHVRLDCANLERAENLGIFVFV